MYWQLILPNLPSALIQNDVKKYTLGVVLYGIKLPTIHESYDNHIKGNHMQNALGSQSHILSYIGGVPVREETYPEPSACEVGWPVPFLATFISPCCHLVPISCWVGSG